MDVKSDAFKNLKSDERKAAQKFADDFTREIGVAWQYDVLVNNAEPVLAEQLAKHPVATKALLIAGDKALGVLTRYTEAKFVNIEPLASGNVFNFITDEQFEKGKARIKLAVVQRDGQWRVRNFNYEAH